MAKVVALYPYSEKATAFLIVFGSTLLETQVKRVIIFSS